MSKKQEEKKDDKAFYVLVAKVYGVPQTGITAIGKQPYLNKDGRLFLLKALRTGKEAVQAMRVEFIRLSTSLLEPSIAKKTLVFKNGVEIEAMGEASKDSVGKESIRQTLNMVAETRALNRAIWQAIGGEVMERVESNINTMELTDEQKASLIEVGRASAEEMDRPAEVGQADEKEARMYEAILNRIDEVQKDEAKLKVAIKKLATWPIEARHKQIVEEKINVYLSKLRVDAKKEPEKKAKKTRKRKSKKRNVIKKGK